MSSVTPYNRLRNFTQYALDHTSAPYNASDHDAELNAIEVTVDGLLLNLSEIQRADGELANGTVHPDTLSSATKAMIGAGSTGNLNWTPRGLWVTATAYIVGDVVEQASVSYVCATAHTAGVFATDHTAGKWIVLSVAQVASGIVFTPTATLAATDVQAAIAELDNELRTPISILNQQLFRGL